MQPKRNAVSLVEDIQEIKEAITWLKDQGDEWYTNFFIPDDYMTACLRSGQVTIFYGKASVFLLRQKSNFQLLYFISTDIRKFDEDILDLSEHTGQTLTVDILSQKKINDSVAEIFLRHGFQKRICLYRMQLTKKYHRQEKLVNDITYAKAEDTEPIHNMLLSGFDELCEQVPSAREIIRAIEHKQILVMRNNNQEVITFFWLEHTGNMVLWRYWFTNPDYRKETLAGIILLKQALAMHAEIKRTLLWVREDNIRARKVYEKLGFKDDGLLDNVFCLIR